MNSNNAMEQNADFAYKCKEYFGNLFFGKEPGPGRKFYLDYLRVLATIFVISGHTISLAASLVEQGSDTWYTLEMLCFIFPASNLLFILISGALLLNVKGEKPLTFYRKRFMKVLIPMILYYVFYVVAKEGLLWLTPKYWLPMIRRILTGPPEEAPHFWLIYVIIWLYVLTPFIRALLHHIPDKVLNGVMFVIFAVNALVTFVPVFSQNQVLSGIVGSFAGVFIFGYFLTKTHGKVFHVLIILAGILSIPTAYHVIHTTDYFGQYLFNNSPVMMVLAGALFIIVKQSESFLPKLSRKNSTDKQHTSHQGHHYFSRLISKYSFSILLIHWGVLHFIVKQFLGVSVLSGGIWGGSILMIVLTFVISLLGAVVIDNTIIVFIEFLLSKFFGLFKKRA